MSEPKKAIIPNSSVCGPKAQQAWDLYFCAALQLVKGDPERAALQADRMLQERCARHFDE